jgi:hypothetical protein
MGNFDFPDQFRLIHQISHIRQLFSPPFHHLLRHRNLNFRTSPRFSLSTQPYRSQPPKRAGKPTVRRGSRQAIRGWPQKNAKVTKNTHVYDGVCAVEGMIRNLNFCAICAFSRLSLFLFLRPCLSSSSVAEHCAFLRIFRPHQRE